MRWLLSWALYWTGDAVSRIQVHVPDEWERLGMAVYRVYQWLMRMAAAVQGDGSGPWRSVQKVED